MVSLREEHTSWLFMPKVSPKAYIQVTLHRANRLYSGMYSYIHTDRYKCAIPVTNKEVMNLRAERGIWEGLKVGKRRGKCNYINLKNKTKPSRAWCDGTHFQFHWYTCIATTQTDIRVS